MPRRRPWKDVPNRRFTILVEEDTDGFVVECPEFQGCYTQGDTLEDALAALRELIEIHLERAAEGKETRQRFKGISIQTMEIPA